MITPRREENDFIIKIKYLSQLTIMHATYLFLFVFSQMMINVSSWYSGIHGPGNIPEMLLQCFNNNQVPCTPLKTLAAWYDQGRQGGLRSLSRSGVAVITYSSADGDDITTYLLQPGIGFVDSEEIKLTNATDIQAHVFCCLENHVEGGAGDS